MTFELAGEPPAIANPSTGEMLSIGRSGDGPGEFSRAGVLNAAADHGVLVWDEGTQRVTRFDQAGRFLESTKLAIHHIQDLVELPTSEIIVNADVRTPDLAGLPLHVFSRTGEHLESIGEAITTIPASARQLLHRRLAVRTRGGFWAAHVARYRLEHRTPAGELRQALERSPEWFDVEIPWGPPTPERPPPPRIVSVLEDDSGYVWIAALVGDRNWTSGLGPARLVRGQYWYGVNDYDAYFDTVIEVVDPVEARVVAWGRFDRCAPYLLDGGYIASFGAAREEVPVLKVWKLSRTSDREAS